MSGVPVLGNLDVLTNRLTTEIENVHAILTGNTDTPGLRELVNVQLETLKYGIKYEIEALKYEISGEGEGFKVANKNDEEIKRLQEELAKAKHLIKLHQLAGSIAERLEEKFKLK